MGDFLKGLIIDRWYKVFIYLGVIALIVSQLVEAKGITNFELMVLSLGFLFIGVGEWRNEKIAVNIKPPNAYTGQAILFENPVRKPNFFGVFLDIIGILFFLAGLVHIIWSLFLSD